jgi:hypothetical protein
VRANWTALLSYADTANDKNVLRKLLLEVDIELLEKIIEVLNPFDEATRLVSADKTPTIHLVASMKLKLLRTVAPSSSDSEPISQLKSQLTAFLTSHFHVASLHRIALLLDPRQKGNRGLMTPEERMASITELKAMVLEVEVAERVGLAEAATTIAGNICYHFYLK